MSDIKFGTSGWRAIISDEFTFANVRLVVQAIADYVKKEKSKKEKVRSVVVGYDTRFLSKEFADETASVLSSNNIKALLSARDVPTPVIAYHIIKNHCAGGINFTASHNPPQYNGIKFSPETGGPAQPEVTKRIEENIAKLKNKKLSFKPNQSLIEIIDPKPAYLKQVEKMVDLKAIKKAKLKLAIDCLYGTSRGYLDLILERLGYKPIVLHDYLNPNFDGKRPEPAPENIRELISLVKTKKLDLGLGTDGDADRFGIIDSDGTYITPNEVITVLLFHLLTTRPNPGTIVARSIATTHMIDMIAKAHNIKVLETPVGFKYFVDVIRSGQCIIAGEESGGLSMSGHLPEKDGILACLLMAEMVAIHKKSVKDMLKHIYKRYGRLYSHRIDLSLTEAKKKSLIDKLRTGAVKDIAGIRIEKTDLKDGIKFYLQDESWILFRPSGTEPIVRIYFESKSRKTLKEIEKTANALIR